MSTSAARRPIPADSWVRRLVLNSATPRARRLDTNIIDSVVGGKISMTIDGASTLELQVHDPRRALLRSGIFNERVQVAIDGRHWSLVSVQKTGDDITLTHEPREVALLRRHTEPRKARRGTLTRAEFVKVLVDELKSQRIPLVCPELHQVQTIASSSTKTRDDRDRDREPGLALDVSFKVEGKEATTKQKEIANAFLEQAVDDGAPRLAALALLMAGINESRLTNPTDGDSSSVGPLQLLDIHLGGSTATNGGRRDVRLVAHLFLTQGFTGKGGAIALARANPSRDPADICQDVQGARDGASVFARWREEAAAILDAFDGGGLDESLGGASGAATTQPYEFHRGDPSGGRESTWDAIVRLAQEVGWRAFVVDGELFFISDERLFASRPRATITEDTPGVTGIDFDFDIGGTWTNGRRVPVADATVSCRLDRWAAPPGSVVLLDNCGPANGRWLVASVSRGIWDADATIELTKPNPKLKEPAATTTVGGSAGTGVGTTSGSKATIGADGKALAPEDAPDEVKAIISRGNGIVTYHYSFGGGHGTLGPPPNAGRDGVGYDCSSSTSEALGLERAIVSGAFESWGDAGPGEWVTVYANAGHVYLEVAGIRFDTSGGASGEGPRWREVIGQRSGFVARHPPGL